MSTTRPTAMVYPYFKMSKMCSFSYLVDTFALHLHLLIGTMSASENLRPIKRFITTHNAEGKSVFSTTLSEEAPTTTLPDGIRLTLMYATDVFPSNLEHEKDVSTYQHFTENPPGVSIPTGTTFRIVEIPPGYTSPMHRTPSLDYGIMIEGSGEQILDSGESRLLKRGDTIIQRGINHAWKNPSDTEWMRMVAIALPGMLEIFGEGPFESTVPGLPAST